MATMTLRAAVLGFACALCACGEPIGPDLEARCRTLCPTLEGCGGPAQNECAEMCATFVFSEECISGMEAATCDEHKLDHPSYADACYPPCEFGNTPDYCEGDAIVHCQPVGLVASRCTTLCTDAGMNYLNVCGTHYGSQLSSTGKPVCWCQ